jgi:hypothetical protein
VIPLIVALLLGVAGVAAIAASELLARRLAPRYVLGRTLSAAREVSIEQAHEMAVAGESRFVRVHGRLSSEEEFPDEHDRPLVYRRKRLEIRQPDGRWQVAASETEGVPFGVETRSSFIRVDGDQLGAGLIVVPRQSEGQAADLPADLAATVEPGAEARLVVEQVSAVEHAYVAGVPTADGDGQVRMSSGANRPLILTTLEIDAAMRLLGGDQRGIALGLSGLFALGIILLIVAALTFVLAFI